MSNQTSNSREHLFNRQQTAVINSFSASRRTAGAAGFLN